MVETTKTVVYYHELPSDMSILKPQIGSAFFRDDNVVTLIFKTLKTIQVSVEHILLFKKFYTKYILFNDIECE